MFDWDRVKSISSTKILASTSLWVFVVPVLYKITNTLKLSEVGVDRVEVPVTFFVLYLSGVLFFLGSMTYWVFCPKFIKSFDTYKSFLDSGCNAYLLEQYLKGVGLKDSKKIKKTLLESVGDIDVEDINSGDVTFISIGSEPDIFNFKKESINDVFWVVRSYFSNKNIILIFISLIFYLLGFLGVGTLFVHNFIIVAPRLLELFSNG